MNKNIRKLARQIIVTTIVIGAIFGFLAIGTTMLRSPTPLAVSLKS